MTDKTRAVTVEIDGEDHQVLLCLWGLILAEEKGFDVSDLELDEEAKERKGDLKQMLDMLWVGMLPFDEDLTRKDLGMKISFGDMEQLGEAFEKIVSRQITDDVREHVAAAENGSAEGKALATSSDS